MPEILGISHVALTVRDLALSVDWYQRVLGLVRLEEVHQQGHHLVVLLHEATDIAINLHEHAANPGEGFAEVRTGLDHLSFLVGGRAELAAWEEHLDALAVAHEPIVVADYGTVLVFRDPDGIQLELFANPQ